MTTSSRRTSAGSAANRSRGSSTQITRGGHVATGTSADRRAKTAANGTVRSTTTRQSIVAAASKVFVEIGYFDARVSDIVKLADVAHGSFYTYFPSKREVFLQVVEQVGVLIDEAVSHNADDVPGDTLGNLERANRRYLRVHWENARLLALVEQVAAADPDVQAHRTAARRRAVERIERTIASLKRRGLADPGLDTHTTAGALVSMLSSFAHWASVQKNEYDEEDVVRTVTEIWVRALRLQPASSAPAQTSPPRARAARTRRGGQVDG